MTATSASGQLGDQHAGLLDRLLGELTRRGYFAADDDHRLADALRGVPRHDFVPSVAWAHPVDAPGYRIDRDDDPRQWFDAAYADIPIITQVGEGTAEAASGQSRDYTSSLSAPSTVVSLLNLLEPERGHRILEIGTGTGWTAALTSHLVGALGEVVTLEVDQDLAATASANLARTGWAPELIVADGATATPGGTFDRVHATAAAAHVPYTWVCQTRPGGLIVTPYQPGFGYGHELRLRVMPDGTARGAFAGFASYMLLRSHRPPQPPEQVEAEVHQTTTRLDPRTIGYAPPGADLAMAALTGLHTSSRHDADTYTLWLRDPAEPTSWAQATYRPRRDVYDVVVAGDRPLWAETEAAFFQWVSAGEPGRDRFGLTVTPDGQWISIDGHRLHRRQ